jgi:hypothetical protein
MPEQAESTRHCDVAGCRRLQEIAFLHMVATCQRCPSRGAHDMAASLDAAAGKRWTLHMVDTVRRCPRRGAHDMASSLGAAASKKLTLRKELLQIGDEDVGGGCRGGGD